MSRVRIVATPAARRVARERSIRLDSVPGTGPGGSVQLSDVMKLAPEKTKISITSLAAAIARVNGVDPGKIKTQGRIKKKDVLAFLEESASVRCIPHSSMRRAIASNMLHSSREIPQYQLFADWDVGALTEFMAEYKLRMKRSGKVSPTYTDFFVKATALALREFPRINSSWHEDCVELHTHINVGVAVALDDGLIVPNIKNADCMSLEEISAERQRLVTLARSGRLLPDDYTGGTFTLSNLGQYPVRHMTPIINLPESGILGIGAIERRATAVDDRLCARPTIGISASFDHRHVDGAVGAGFLAVLKRLLAEPERL